MILPLEKIAEVVPQSGTILDVGCGYGLLDLYLATNYPERQVIGSELNGKRVSIAKKISENITNLKFYEKNLLDRNEIKQVDCVILIDLLHHVTYEQQNDLLQSVSSILPVGGKLIIKDMNDHPIFKYYWNLWHDKLMTGFDKLYFIGSKNLINKLESHGFSVKSAENLSHPLYAHYLLVCEKI